MARFLKDRELAFMLKPVRIAFKGSAGGGTSDGLGHETKEVPRWHAEILVEEGVVQIEEEGFEGELVRAVSRERIQGNEQVSTMSSDFYVRLKRYLGEVKVKSEENGNRMDEYRRTAALAYDLLTMRTRKILHLAASSSTPQDLSTKMTFEERLLLDHVHRIVGEWRKAVLDGVI